MLCDIWYNRQDNWFCKKRHTKRNIIEGCFLLNMQKPLGELGLKRLWSAVNSPNIDTISQSNHNFNSAIEETKLGVNCPLPLLQVWPSADSPRRECAEDASYQRVTCLENNHNDSGIESTQVSTSPVSCASTSPIYLPTPSIRRPSSALLHPDHARLLRLHPVLSSEQNSMEDISEPEINHILSLSSSTSSSLTSVAAAVSASVACSPRLTRSADSRRRSSAITTRYSVFDGLDLEYALLKAAARGSIGPYSLGESLHKLTFTQSLAFPALARGLTGKRKRSQQNNNPRPLNPNESGLNSFAKVMTALVLVFVSILVFAVVYKFVRT